MNILYCLNSGNFGGMEQHVADLVQGMIKKQHNVHVWCVDGPVCDLYKSLGASVTNKKTGLDIDLRYVFALSEYLKKQKIDVIHAHELKAGTNAVLAAFLAGTKIKVTHIHTPLSEWPNATIYKKVILFFQKLAYSFLVNHFSTFEIALTESKKQLKLQEGIRSEKIKVIPNGLDLEKFIISEEQQNAFRSEICKKHSIPQSKIILGNISRFTEEKGHKFLVEAFTQINKKFPNTQLLLAGGGLLEPIINDLIDKLGIKESVTITGRFDEKDKIKYYSALDVFVFPTLAEGFGIVLLEAMAFNIPLLCSDLEVFKEINTERVTYFKRADLQDMEEKLTLLLTNFSPAQYKISDLKSYLSKWSLDNFVNAYNELYESLNARS